MNCNLVEYHLIDGKQKHFCLFLFLLPVSFDLTKFTREVYLFAEFIQYIYIYIYHYAVLQRPVQQRDAVQTDMSSCATTNTATLQNIFVAEQPYNRFVYLTLPF